MIKIIRPKNIYVIKDALLRIPTVLRIFFFAVLFIGLNGCVTTKTGNHFKGGTAPNSDRADIHAQLARGYMEKKQYSIAKTELEKGLKVDPNHSDSNYVMALLMLELEQFKETEEFFTRAVRSNANNSAAAHDFGVYLCQTGQEGRSVAYFDIAVSNPFFESPQLSYMRAGECLSRIKDPRAEGYLKKALSVNPKLSPALFRLAKLKYETKSYLSARAYIERFYAITKPQPAALLLGYKIELKLRADDVAAKYRLQLLETFPGSLEARSLRTQSRN